MPSSREVGHTEQRIAEVDALRETIERLRRDLNTYQLALRRELDWLRQEAAAAERTVAPPAPTTNAHADLNLEEVTEEELKATVSSPYEDEKSEKGKPVSVLISDGAISSEPLSGWVMERPPGGLKILVDDQFPLGTVIGVRPTREHPDAEWINVCVKHIRPERQSYLMTCTFVGRPPWSALNLLNG